MTETTSATAAAAAKISKPKKARKVSHAKQEQTALPLPGPIGPEFGDLATDRIEVRDQVRKAFDPGELQELAADIATRGILQPLTVRRTDSGFVLVAGERRLRAAILAGLASVPVLISAISDDEHSLAQLAENIQRADLTLAEEAAAVKIMHDELGMVKDVAAKLHKSVAWVSKRLSLARGLGHFAGALLADGITEDIELIQAVDKLDKATFGSNSAWALCKKIRAGKAGREDAREALRMATTPKATPTGKLLAPEKPTHTPDPMGKSNSFRHWIISDNSWHAEQYLPLLWTLAPDTEGRYNVLTARITALNEELNRMEEEHDEVLSKAQAATRETYGHMALHEAWMQFQEQQK